MAYVLTLKKAPEKVLGCYTLSSASIELSRLPVELVVRLPKYFFMPTVLIGRLAVDESSQGSGFGGLLLLDAIRRVKKVAHEIGVYAVTVEAIDGQAKRFYEKFGFRLVNNSSNCIFIQIR